MTTTGSGTAASSAPPTWVRVLLGLVLIFAGLFVLGDVALATLISTMFIGATALIAGGFEIIHAFWTKGWGGFLWRGWHIQHLYTLNSYRNGYVHEDEQPYQGVLGSPNKWVIPQEVSDSISSGKVLGQIAELIVRDLLEWYIPWHEQVYLPWLGGLGGGTAGRP